MSRFGWSLWWINTNANVNTPIRHHLRLYHLRQTGSRPFDEVIVSFLFFYRNNKKSNPLSYSHSHSIYHSSLVNWNCEREDKTRHQTHPFLFMYVYKQYAMRTHASHATQQNMSISLFSVSNAIAFIRHREKTNDAIFLLCTSSVKFNTNFEYISLSCCVLASCVLIEDSCNK